MGVTHSGITKRKKSGGRKRANRGKRRRHAGSLPILTTIGKNVKRKILSKSGKPTPRLYHAEKANVLNQKTGEYKLVKIVTAKENPANRNYARRNIVTKGSIIETEAGAARVTSRPGQDGVINAVIIEQKA